MAENVILPPPPLPRRILFTIAKFTNSSKAGRQIFYLFQRNLAIMTQIGFLIVKKFIGKLSGMEFFSNGLKRDSLSRYLRYVLCSVTCWQEEEPVRIFTFSASSPKSYSNKPLSSGAKSSLHIYCSSAFPPANSSNSTWSVHICRISNSYWRAASAYTNLVRSTLLVNVLKNKNNGF